MIRVQVPNASRGVLTVVMVGAVGALWISLVGLFVLAVHEDSAIATQVADSAMKLVGLAITAFSSIAGVHVYVNRPQTTPTPPLLPVSAPQLAAPVAAAGTPPNGVTA